jgi:hypothetical protein
MKTWLGAGMVLLAALTVEGCAASTTQGSGVRVHTTSAAFEHRAPSQAFSSQSKQAGRKESPTAHACKAGSSKACNELGDRLAIKHAYSEARQWYGTSCDRVRGSMRPNAERLLLLSQNLRNTEASPSMLAQLKNEAAEIKARVQGCFDTAEMVKTDGELKAAVPFYEATCEFSTLVPLVGDTMASLEHVTESACATGQAARAKLGNNVPFQPQLFADLAEPKPQPGKGKQAPAAAEDSMVFSGDEL